MDRFGEIPKSVDNLLRISLIRVQAHRLYMSEVKGKNGEIRFLMNANAEIRAQEIPALLKKYPKLSFNAKGSPMFLFRYSKCGMVERDAENLLALTEELLGGMEGILL